jgi:enoyl-CoA hydratase
MEYKHIEAKIEGFVAIITLSRKEALNALNQEMISELHNFFFKNWMQRNFRCVIITGAGKAFAAGADVGELAECDVAGATKTSMIGQYLTKTIENFPCPVIAAINGFALGGGCELAMACDIRLASEKAKLGQPEINLGIIPGYGGTQRLSRLVGRGKAKELIFTGDMITAAEAHRIGLVDEVYPVEELMDRAMEMAKKIVSKSGPLVAAAKEVIDRGLDVGLSAGLDFEKTVFGNMYGYADAHEGLNAFLEKRKPNFTHGEDK